MVVRDPETPWYARVWAAMVVAYAFSPLDLIPDPIPVLGLLDDVVLLPLGIALAVRLIPNDVLVRSRLSAAALSQEPRSRWGAAGVILVWILLATGTVLLLRRR